MLRQIQVNFARALITKRSHVALLVFSCAVCAICCIYTLSPGAASPKDSDFLLDISEFCLIKLAMGTPGSSTTSAVPA